MIEEINLPTIKIEEKADNRTVFAIEPCYPGYGTTLGNAMRRIMLSSLPGAAIIGVKIKGTDHEFSPIQGVKEDAVQIILQLKKLRFKIHTDEVVTIKLVSQKMGEVTGADFEISSNVELINPEVVLAHVSEKGALEIEAQIARGMGYLSSEKIDERGFAIGTIAVDAAFSPVERVAFEVEPTRVGEKINYDKLILDVLTDGTITPEEALKASAKILAHQLTIFGAEIEMIEEEEAGGEAVAGISKDYNVDEINLSIRTTNALVNNGIKKASEIIAIGPEKLSEMKGLGAKALDEISERFSELGLSFNPVITTEEQE